jgi:hypothetical protein
MGEEFRPVAPIDPTNLRPLLYTPSGGMAPLDPPLSRDGTSP